MKHLVSLFGLMLLGMPVALAAQPHPCAGDQVIEGQVGTRDARTNSFSLKGDGRLFRFSAMQGIFPFPLKMGDRVHVHVSAQREDRYGRWGAQVWKQDGEWVQGRLLRDGVARLAGDAERSDCLVSMKTDEREAIARKAGLWAVSNAIFRSDETNRILQENGRFVVVEGRVLSIGNRSRRVYLNFGPKWSEDFTVSLVKKGRGAFNGEINRIVEARGRTVRVRGIVEDRQGPLIRLMNEGQIDFLN